MLRRLARDVARAAAYRAAQPYTALTSGVQHIRKAYALHEVHQSTLAMSSDIKVSIPASQTEYLIPTARHSI